MTKKKLLIINTGGTISSVSTDSGYKPQPGVVASALDSYPELSHPLIPDYDLLEYTPLIDSSDITLSDWNRIGEDILAHYARYDGFVVLHGTDTMAYTSSALSFMLQNLAKPVIITGAQIPLGVLRTDAKENLLTAMQLACSPSLYEVCIYFEHRLLRGNRAQKVSNQRFKAFDSPNFPPLARAGIDIVWRDNLLCKPKGPFSLQRLNEQVVIANFRLFPGFARQALLPLLAQNIGGLVLETYGSGNAQSRDLAFLTALKDACDQGMVIVNCTQCQQGSVNMSAYNTGQHLQMAGLISGFDMTPEAAHTKLLYLLSTEATNRQIKKLMGESLRGELSR